jgi:hypothetical protein
MVISFTTLVWILVMWVRIKSLYFCANQECTLFTTCLWFKKKVFKHFIIVFRNILSPSCYVDFHHYCKYWGFSLIFWQWIPLLQARLSKYECSNLLHSQFLLLLVWKHTFFLSLILNPHPIGMKVLPLCGLCSSY